MKSTINLVLCFLALAVISGTNQACADGDPNDRPLTAAEKSYFSKILGTIDTALPRVPANWAAIQKPSTRPPKSVFEGSEKGSLKAVYKGEWGDQSRKSHQNDSPMAENNAEEMQRVMQELISATQSQDKAAYKQAEEKFKALQRKGQKPAPGKDRPVQDPSAADACLQVEVAVNQTVVGVRNAIPLNIAGVPKAFMADDGNPGKKGCPSAKAVAFLGSWGDGEAGGEYTYFRSNWRKGLPHTTAKNIVIEVRAREQRAKEYLRSVKWDELKALLVK
jgi:hypothetical protein